MLFTDSIFLFYFLPLALVLHRLAAGPGNGGEYSNRARITIFLLTLVFYGWKEPWWLIPFLICIGFDFIWAQLLARFQDQRRRKLVLWLSITQNIGLLAIFKYWHFVVSNVARISPHAASLMPMFSEHGGWLPLPPGISFYTFESMSFVIDTYRREIEPPKRPQEFFAFIGMFPRFIAGPIVRYKSMVGQFKQYAGMDLERGLFTFAIGLFLKCCFADQFSIFVSYAFERQGSISFLSAWVGVFAYTLQLYFDFSGYSLMAIGLGRCLGFRFPTNFNRPYISKSLQEFWRRWHISLSTWLRDYLYISLGGNRVGKFRTYLNIFLTMLIGGLWHGSDWTFVVWGAWHGIFLCAERLFPIHKKLPASVARALTLLCVMLGWALFRAKKLPEAFKIIGTMLNPFSNSLRFNPEGLLVHPLSLVFCIAGILYCFVLEPRIDIGWIEGDFEPEWKQKWLFAPLMASSLLLAWSAEMIPFVYFQF